MFYFLAFISSWTKLNASALPDFPTKLKSVLWLGCFGSLKGIVEEPLKTESCNAGWELFGEFEEYRLAIGRPEFGSVTWGCEVLLWDKLSKSPRAHKPSSAELTLFSFAELTGGKTLPWGEIKLFPQLINCGPISLFVFEFEKRSFPGPTVSVTQGCVTCVTKELALLLHKGSNRSVTLSLTGSWPWLTKVGPAFSVVTENKSSNSDFELWNVCLELFSFSFFGVWFLPERSSPWKTSNAFSEGLRSETVAWETNGCDVVVVPVCCKVETKTS